MTNRSASSTLLGGGTSSNTVFFKVWARTIAPNGGTLTRKATIRDVAKRAGVGIGTVSRVLNQSEAVSQRTRRKVLDVIAELDYMPSINARRLALGKALSIGVIVPFFTNPSYIERLRGIEEVLSPSEYDLVLHNAETAARRDFCLNDVSQRHRVDGLLVITHTPSDEQVESFRRVGLPVVLVDARHSGLDSVTIDDTLAAYNATRHLIELGHRKIGFVSDFLETSLNFRPVRDRHVGYYQALEEAGITYRTDYHKQGPHGRLPARMLALDLLRAEDRPSAIFAYSDTQAIGVLEAAAELGLAVPEDLSVIGFDDIEAATYWSLTTVRQPLFESGWWSCRRLLDLLERGGQRIEHRELATELVVRQTTAPPSA